MSEKIISLCTPGCAMFPKGGCEVPCLLDLNKINHCKVYNIFYIIRKCLNASTTQGVSLLFMQSDGGLTQASSFTGSHAILSGPAGGVVGYAQTSPSGGLPLVGFDMGGTSTDVSRYNCIV